MKRMREGVLLALLLLALAAPAQAEESVDVGADITVIGTVVLMDDGLYLDDGSRLYLLIDMEDPQAEGLTVEVVGQLVMIDDQPAIKVREMTVLGDVPPAAQPEESEEAPPNRG